MTVAELIAELKKLPQHREVWMECFGVVNGAVKFRRPDNFAGVPLRGPRKLVLLVEEIEEEGQ